MISSRALVRSIFIAVVFTLSSGVATAQAKSAPVSVDSTKPASIGADQQWEYIVVSFGKTLFGGPQKTLGYGLIGLSSGQEAIGLEKNLDVLGRFGWEVVTIIGVIGGDQQILLKRKFSRNLTNTEYRAILKGKDLYIKDLIDIMEREEIMLDEEASNIEQRDGKPRLIDLDAAEKRAFQVERVKAIIQGYRDSFATSELSKFSSATVDYINNGIRIKITSDVTSPFLVDGNNYRKNDIDNFINPKMNSFMFRHPKLYLNESVAISLNAVIQFNGAPNSVTKFFYRWNPSMNDFRGY